MSESKRKESAEKQSFIMHWVSFLLFILCIDRYGSEIVTNYLHDIGIHMPKQFENISFSTVNGDMFEETFAEWKLFMRSSCHRKSEAEISGLMRRNKMEHYYILHPSMKRSKCNTAIKKVIDKFKMCNIVLKKEIVSSTKWSTMIENKKNEYKLSGYDKFMQVLPGGDLLLNFTDNDTAPVFLPSSSMLCVCEPEKSDNTCKNVGCTKIAQSRYCMLCVDCCIQNNCKIGGELTDEICQPHYNTNKLRRKRAQDEREATEKVADNSSSNPVDGVVARQLTHAQRVRSKPRITSSNVQLKRKQPETLGKSSKKKKSRSISNLSCTNGTAGACTCFNSTCKTKKCPCKTANVKCTSQCHTGSKGQRLVCADMCSRMMAGVVQTSQMADTSFL